MALLQHVALSTEDTLKALDAFELYGKHQLTPRAMFVVHTDNVSLHIMRNKIWSTLAMYAQDSTIYTFYIPLRKEITFVDAHVVSIRSVQYNKSGERERSIKVVKPDMVRQRIGRMRRRIEPLARAYLSAPH